MATSNIMKARFPLLLLLGIVFLASVSVSFGLAYWEKENPSHDKCLQSCNGENDAYRHQACRARCNLIKNPESEEKEEPPRRAEQQGRHQQPRRQRGGQQEEEQEEREQERRRHQEREQGRRGEGEEEQEEGEPREERQRRQREKQQRQQSQREREQEEEQEEEEEGEWRGRRRREDPEERERVREREREEQRREQEKERQREERQWRREKREERQREERQWRREKREQQEEREQRKNPYYFSSNRFQTRYKNQHGQIRVLQRFDQRSNQLQNLQYYRIVEYESEPNTLFLPHHSDADYILVVLRGKATITLLNSTDRESYNLESGDALRLPAGTTSYLLNRDDSQNLRVVKLAITLNKAGQFEDFFPSGSENLSYLRGFSRNTLEATFNTQYDEIQRTLLGQEEQEQEQEQQSQQEGVIVRVSKEQVKQLSKHAKSSSKSGKPSESGPFNLGSNKPIYSNKFGRFYEITPEKNPQLQDLAVSLSAVEINEGALFLPHYNSKAIEVVVVNKGKGRLELVGLRKQQQQQEEEEEEEEEEEVNRQVQRYKARLSEGDIFIIPAGYPVSINASSNLQLLGFGINAENNQRNFLAGEDDNVLSQIERQAKELTFPGSAQEVERLLKNQEESHFANAQPQQSEEGNKGRAGPLSSILGAFY